MADTTRIGEATSIAEVIPDSKRTLIKFDVMPRGIGEPDNQPREFYPVPPCNPRTGRIDKSALSFAEVAELSPGKSEHDLVRRWRWAFREVVPAEFADQPETFFAKLIERRRRRRRHARRAGGVLLVNSVLGKVAVGLNFFETDSEARRFARAIATDAGELERAIADGVPGVVVLENCTPPVTADISPSVAKTLRNPPKSPGRSDTGRSVRRVARGGGNLGEIGGVE